MTLLGKLGDRLSEAGTIGATLAEAPSEGRRLASGYAVAAVGLRRTGVTNSVLGVVGRRCTDGPGRSYSDVIG